MTSNPEINVIRVRRRQSIGGHGVHDDKIVSRYYKTLKLIPRLVSVCDILHIYDNTEEPFRIFKKRKDIYYHWPNEYWSNENIENLSEINEFVN